MRVFIIARIEKQSPKLAIYGASNISWKTIIYLYYNHKHTCTHWNKALWISLCTISWASCWGENCQLYACNWHLKTPHKNMGVLKDDFWGFGCPNDGRMPCWLKLWPSPECCGGMEFQLYILNNCVNKEVCVHTVIKMFNNEVPASISSTLHWLPGPFCWGENYYDW